MYKYSVRLKLTSELIILFIMIETTSIPSSTWSWRTPAFLLTVCGVGSMWLGVDESSTTRIAGSILVATLLVENFCKDVNVDILVLK